MNKENCKTLREIAEELNIKYTTLQNWPKIYPNFPKFVYKKHLPRGNKFLSFYKFDEIKKFIEQRTLPQIAIKTKKQKIKSLLKPIDPAYASWLAWCQVSDCKNFPQPIAQDPTFYDLDEVITFIHQTKPQTIYLHDAISFIKKSIKQQHERTVSENHLSTRHSGIQRTTQSKAIRHNRKSRTTDLPGRNTRRAKTENMGKHQTNSA
jgi:hypothetical protein